MVDQAEAESSCCWVPATGEDFEATTAAVRVARHHQAAASLLCV